MMPHFVEGKLMDTNNLALFVNSRVQKIFVDSNGDVLLKTHAKTNI